MSILGDSKKYKVISSLLDLSTNRELKYCSSVMQEYYSAIKLLRRLDAFEELPFFIFENTKDTFVKRVNTSTLREKIKTRLINLIISIYKNLIHEK